MLNKKHAILSSFLSFLCFSISYILSINMSQKDYLIMVILSVMIGLYSYHLQKSTGVSMTHGLWFIGYLLGLFWIVAPIWEAIGDNPHFGKLEENIFVFPFVYDFVFSVSICFVFVWMIYHAILHHTSKNIQNHSSFIPSYFVLSTLLIMLIFTYPLVFAMHWMLYDIPLDENAMQMVVRTTPNEAWNYIENISSLENSVFLFLVFLLIVVFIYRFIVKIQSKIILPKEESHISFSFFLSIFFFSCYIAIISFFVFPNTSLGHILVSAYSFQEDSRAFMENHKTHGLWDFDKEQEFSDKTKNESILLVIGESASRSHMHVYHPKDLLFQNTPWMESIGNDPEFILFENAFACYNTTVEVLKRALTNSSQYNQIRFRDSITLVDIAKLNGYHTHWYSNQNKLSDGAEVTMMGRTAQDFFFFRDETKALENSYDRKLLDLLKEKEEDLSHGKHFIVLHLMGSHFDYRNDYTNEYNKFGEDSKEAMYANSILYTDALLREIYEYGRDHLNMKLMLYFSDHGENMQFTHHPNKKYLDTIEIPMLIYASKDFMESDDNFKQRINILSQRKDFYFTNDMLYNLMIGLLGWNTTENRWYDPKEDLSSNQYSYSTRKDITSMGMPIDDFLSYK